MLNCTTGKRIRLGKKNKTSRLALPSLLIIIFSLVTQQLTQFIVLFVVIQRFKPSIIYEHDGSLRQFGLGNNKKTVRYVNLKVKIVI